MADFSKIANQFFNLKTSSKQTLNSQDTHNILSTLFEDDSNFKMDTSELFPSAGGNNSLSLESFTKANTALSDANKGANSTMNSNSSEMEDASLSQEIVDCQSNLESVKGKMDNCVEKSSQIDQNVAELTNSLSNSVSIIQSRIDGLNKSMADEEKAIDNNKELSDSEKAEKKKDIKDKYEPQIKAEEDKIKAEKTAASQKLKQYNEQKTAINAEAKQYQAAAERISNQLSRIAQKLKNNASKPQDKTSEVKTEDIADRLVDNEMTDETIAATIISNLGDDADFIETDDLVGTNYQNALAKANKMVEAHKAYAEGTDEDNVSGSVENNQDAKDNFLAIFSEARAESGDENATLSVMDKTELSAISSVADDLNNNNYVSTNDTEKATKEAKALFDTSAKSIEENEDKKEDKI